METNLIEDNHILDVTPMSESKAEASEAAEVSQPKEPESEDVFIAFARIFSGTLKRGQSLYVLGPKHTPEDALQKVRIKLQIHRCVYLLCYIFS